jgi:hypothetical protein
MLHTLSQSVEGYRVLDRLHAEFHRVVRQEAERQTARDTDRLVEACAQGKATQSHINACIESRVRGSDESDGGATEERSTVRILD